MRSVPALALDDADIFDKIAAAKRPPRRARLQGLRPTVIAAYGAYAAAVPDVGDLPEVSLTNLQREALIHAFTVETEPMTRLRSRLMGRALVVRCPFCGLGESSTLDHYLPKEKHPQFAVLSGNLVPSCALCNARKSQLVIGGNRKVRLFLHPYFDDVPNEPFLCVEIAPSGDLLKVAFRLVRPVGMEQLTFLQLQSHFTRLGLADRYRRMSLIDLRDQYRALNRVYKSGDDITVADELNRQAQDLESNYGVNYWRAVLYRALAADESFCDGGFRVLKRIQ